MLQSWWHVWEWWSFYSDRAFLCTLAIPKLGALSLCIEGAVQGPFEGYNFAEVLFGIT